MGDIFFFSIVERQSRVSHNDRQDTDLPCNYHRSSLQRYRQFRFQTEHSEGKVNVRFQQFADDYGFHVRPCIAGRPRTKAKVEAPMKLLDEIMAYNGKLDYYELNKLVQRINNRVNAQVNQGTGRIPLMYFQEEKASLCSLPADTIRKPYQISDHTVKVNHSSIFQYRGCQYSVPPEYVGKYVSLQVYDGYIHVYCAKSLVRRLAPGT